jgi:copper chaperone CopZ
MSGNCHVERKEKTPSQTENARQETVYLEIRGMGCPSCEARVRNSLISVHGVLNAEVSHQRGTGILLYNPDLVEAHALVEAVAQAGGDGRHEYKARLLS